MIETKINQIIISAGLQLIPYADEIFTEAPNRAAINYSYDIEGQCSDDLISTRRRGASLKYVGVFSRLPSLHGAGTTTTPDSAEVGGERCLKKLG